MRKRDRATRLVEYVAHLKVLRATAAKAVEIHQWNLVTVTEGLMIAEAEVGTLDFRIEEVQAELDKLT